MTEFNKKTQIKIFVNNRDDQTEQQVNEFITGRKVVDIKFNSGIGFCSVMVIYEIA